MSDVVLRSRGVRKAFEADDRILEGADLALERGEILLLMGPNGVGKTVLLSCLAGSRRPGDGTVEVFGEPVDGATGQVEFLLQDSKAFDRLTGRENVAFYADVHPSLSDRWRRYVETLGVEADLDKLVGDYSEGMKRKLEFALALSADVPIYLLDEPTAGVDLTSVQQFHDAILERRDAGGSFVVTSHRPIDVNVADRIAFMPDGSVSRVGTPEELLAAVPTVVTVAGREAMRAIESRVLGGRLFPVGGEARGFLPPGETIESLRAAIGVDGVVEEIEPTYTDLYNYYVHFDDG